MKVFTGDKHWEQERRELRQEMRGSPMVNTSGEEGARISMRNKKVGLVLEDEHFSVLMCKAVRGDGSGGI